MSKLSFREDWPVIPYLTIVLLGVIVSILDFIVIQQWVLQVNIWFSHSSTIHHLRVFYKKKG